MARSSKLNRSVTFLMNFYIWKNEREHGPFSEAELRAQMESGVFSAKDFARREDVTEWKPLTEVLGARAPAAATAPAQSRYLAMRNKERKGPFIEEELRAALQRGELMPSDMSWKEGEAGWIPLAKRPEFSKAVAEAAAPPAPEAPAQVAADAPSPKSTFVGVGAALGVVVVLALLIGAGWSAYRSFAHPHQPGAPAAGPMSDAALDTAAATPTATPAGNPAPAPTPTPAPPAPAASSTSWFSSLAKIAGSVTSSSTEDGELNPTPPANPSQRAQEILRYLTDLKQTSATPGQLAVSAAALDDVLTQNPPDADALEKSYIGTDPATRKLNFLQLMGGNYTGMFEGSVPPRLAASFDLMQGQALLPARGWRGPQRGSPKPGILLREFLTTFRGAYMDLWEKEHPPHDNGASALTDMKNLVPPLSEDLPVIQAEYEEGFFGRIYYFWYKKQPDNLADLVKNLDPHDPIYRIGAPVSEAPTNEPEVMHLLGQQAGDAHRPEEPLPKAANFVANPDLVNSGAPVPLSLILNNEAAVLTDQNAMSVEVDMRGVPLDDSVIRDDIVKSLTDAGIKVLPETDGTYPKLVMDLDATKGMVTQRFGFQEFLSLSGDLSYRCLYPSNVKGGTAKFIVGRVWVAGIFGMSSSVDDVRNTIQTNLTDKFVSDYKSVNGK